MSVRHASNVEQDRIMAVKARLMEGIKAELESGQITKPEFLCLFAFVTGMMIAMQDQRAMTPEQAMEMVIKNIEAGNSSAIEQMFEGAGGHA